MYANINIIFLKFNGRIAANDVKFNLSHRYKFNAANIFITLILYNIFQRWPRL